MKTERAALHHALPGRSVVVNGVRFDASSLGGLRDAAAEFVECGRSHVVTFLAAHPTVIAMDAPAYRAILSGADLNVADGMSIVWAMRLSGVRTQKTAGTDAMRSLMRWAAREDLGAYLFGGAAGVAERVADRLEAEVGAKVAGAETPSFGPVDELEIAAAADRIRSSGADLVWVGLGTPKQHLVAERLREHRAAPVILCVGAAFDFVAGVKRRPPAWTHDIGLEWVGRLVDEPARLWHRYLVGNVRFVSGVARDAVRPR